MFGSAVGGVRVTAVTYRTRHDSIYISSTNGRDQTEGMDLLAYARETRGDHNRERAKASEIKRDQARSRGVIKLVWSSVCVP